MSRKSLKIIDNKCPLCNNVTESSIGYMIDSMYKKIPFNKESCFRCGLTNWNPISPSEEELKE